MSLFTPRRARRAVVAGLTLALSASATTLAAAPAHSADRIPLVIVGTSDVKDSGLVENVIEPQFEALYPQYDLQYLSQGTGAAFDTVQKGGGAALIVHAAALENQFVASGYSLESAGRLIFWGDYVLAGPTSDPAGVAASAPNDVVAAFEKIAAAGAAGTATFVTRGAKPGTAVQERSLWALTQGVSTCAVSAGDGGGRRPSIAGGTCAATDSTTDQPTWYRNGSAGSQADNVRAASTCASGPYPNGNCYVFTDRGTLKFLQSQGIATNLKIVTRNNTPTARGGRDALINVFHAYGVNRASVPAGSKTDPTGAKLFLDYMTSAAGQASMQAFLSDNGADPTFVASAAPKLTAEVKQDTVTPGKKIKVKGNISNVVPGYPALGDEPVNLLQSKGSSLLAVPKTVETVRTDAAGNYVFKHKLKAGYTYRVGVPSITKLELPNLTPQFSDILTATSTSLGVVGGFKTTPVKKLGNHRFVVSGKLASKSDGKGKIKVFAGKGAKLKKIGTVKVKDGVKVFAFRGHLAPGTWRLQLVFDDKGDTLPGASKVLKVTV
jgi:tungstate transport system substrate-binding protein